MASVKDDRGFNQEFADSKSTRIRMERRSDYIISQMAVDPPKSVMEIGCGTGLNSFILAKKTGMNTLGTDLCVPFIADARKKFQLPNLRFEVLDFNHPAQLKGERFDYIIGNGILHHLYHHLEEAFANMFDLLKDGGKIIFIEPNILNPYVYLIFSYSFLRSMANLEPDEMAFSKEFVARLLLKTGYKNIKVEYKDFLLPGIPDALIKPSIILGDVLEKLPLVNKISQSIFIQADR